ncbi:MULTISPECIES: hypothetical protein [Oerskovia]|uniref:Uncharacterized protein n=1 Tax=Oerskovia gallyi TaxID=2762226 RepID=A0ABR8V2N7_9CELL|nr:hypothetical protein [Oerskovia gallyi]MBD7999056.1 hypothetical protein [Oerskovia gallyi]
MPRGTDRRHRHEAGGRTDAGQACWSDGPSERTGRRQSSTTGERLWVLDDVPVSETVLAFGGALLRVGETSLSRWG